MSALYMYQGSDVSRTEKDLPSHSNTHTSLDAPGGIVIWNYKHNTVCLNIRSLWWHYKYQIDFHIVDSFKISSLPGLIPTDINSWLKIQVYIVHMEMSACNTSWKSFHLPMKAAAE